MRSPAPKNSGRRPKRPAAKAPAPRPNPRPNPRASLELTDNPRLAAFRVLKETAEGRTPEEALESHGRLLSPRDLGLTTALVYETLRHQSFLDTLIRARLTRGQAPGELGLVLRLGLAQLIFFSRLGDHAVVMETVTLAKIVVPGRQGLVNAILRGFLRDREAGLPWPPPLPATGDARRDMAAQYSCPPWLLHKLWRELGPEETEQLLISTLRHTPPTLRLNPLKTDRLALAEKLPFPCRPTELSPWGLLAENFSGQPAEWPGFAEGLFAVQDEASQLLGLLAGDLAGAEVLDACAGLGGKGLHLATLHPGARLTCLDKDSKKLEALQREAGRLGCLAAIKTETRDLLNDPPSAARYDLVLLDAPCSGLGVIRRRPDLKWNKSQEDLVRLADLQLRLLLAAADSVRPGGRLIFGICSFSREEGPENTQKFLAQRPDCSAAPPPQWPESLRPLLSAEHNLTLWPHRQGTDGFFWAMFTKK